MQSADSVLWETIILCKDSFKVFKAMPLSHLHSYRLNYYLIPQTQKELIRIFRTNFPVSHMHREFGSGL